MAELRLPHGVHEARTDGATCIHTLSTPTMGPAASSGQSMLVVAGGSLVYAAEAFLSLFFSLFLLSLFYRSVSRLR